MTGLAALSIVGFVFSRLLRLAVYVLLMVLVSVVVAVFSVLGALQRSVVPQMAMGQRR